MSTNDEHEDDPITDVGEFFSSLIVNLRGIRRCAQLRPRLRLVEIYAARLCRGGISTDPAKTTAFVLLSTIEDIKQVRRDHPASGTAWALDYALSFYQQLLDDLETGTSSARCEDIPPATAALQVARYAHHHQQKGVNP